MSRISSPGWRTAPALWSMCGLMTGSGPRDAVIVPVQPPIWLHSAPSGDPADLIHTEEVTGSIPVSPTRSYISLSRSLWEPFL
jgi:hypothetical protein